MEPDKILDKDTEYMLKKLFVGFIIFVSVFLYNDCVKAYEFKSITENKTNISIDISEPYIHETGRVFMISEAAVFDGISASVLADIKETPVIVISGKNMSSEEENTLKKNGIKEVTIIGGADSISLETEGKLKDMEVEVKRIHGIDRNDTSMKILDEISSVKEVDEIYCVNPSMSMNKIMHIYLDALKRDIPVIWESRDIIEQVEQKYGKDNITYFGKDREFSRNINYNKIIHMAEDKNTKKVFAINSNKYKVEDITTSISSCVVASKYGYDVMITEGYITSKDIECIEKSNLEDIITIGFDYNKQNILNIFWNSGMKNVIILILLIFIIFFRAIILK